MTNRSAKNSDLSGRERLIAEDYARGENYQQIAVRLCLAPSTARAHLATIYRKPGVSSKLELRDTSILVVIAQPEPVVEFPARPEKPSVAVLAFENMSGD